MLSSMRWSWTAFGTGLLGGALLSTLLWFVIAEPEVRLAPTDAASAAEAADATEEMQTRSGPSVESEDEPAADDSPLPSELATRAHRRQRVTRPHVEPASPSEPTGSPVKFTFTDPGAYTTTSPQIVRFIDSKRSVMKLRISNGGFVTFTGFVGARSANPAPALLGWSKKRAADEMAEGLSASRENADRLLRDDTYASHAAAIGLAIRADPPALDLLLSAARDTEYPDLRGAALLAAAEVDLEDDGVRSLILDLALDSDPFVRRSASDLLRRLGDEGGRRAAAILLKGDYSSEVIDALTVAVAGSSAAANFLGAAPPPDAAFKVVTQLATRLAAPKNERDERLAATLPDLVRPLLESPSAASHAAQILPLLADLGHGAFLRGVASAPMYGQSVRSAAANAALRNEKTRADGISAVATILSDPSATVALVRGVLAPIDGELLDDPTLRSALEAAARSHPSAWVRSDANARLAAHASGGRGAIVIHEASYGVGNDWVNVTDDVRSAITGETLSIQAGNHLQGDPKVGHVKSLRVEYSLGGTRRLKRVSEGQTLRIP